MADLSLSNTDRVEIVESLLQATLPAAEAITAGNAVRIDTNGKFTKSNATTATEADTYGIAGKSVAAGMPLTAVRLGVMSGWDLSALTYSGTLYLSNTDGALATTAGTVSKAIAKVLPVHGSTLGNSAAKVLEINCL